MSFHSQLVVGPGAVFDTVAACDTVRFGLGGRNASPASVADWTKFARDSAKAFMNYKPVATRTRSKSGKSKSKSKRAGSRSASRRRQSAAAKKPARRSASRTPR